MAYEYRKFYIDGQWVEPVKATEFKVINPATEEVAGAGQVRSIGHTSWRDSPAPNEVSIDRWFRYWRGPE